MYNILVCDDDKDIVSALRIYLESEGYGVLTAYNGAEAVRLAASGDVQLAVMDIMMPVMDGITAMVKLREFSNIPVILLTAKGEDTDKVLGLNVGADDYVTKPFNPVELMARVRSVLRRYTSLGGGTAGNGMLRVGGICLNDREKSVTLDGEAVSLTPTEYDILRFLMQHPGEVFRPETIYTGIRSESPLGAESSIAVHIRHLREKLEIDPSDPRYITAVWGQGYKISDKK